MKLFSSQSATTLQTSSKAFFHSRTVFLMSKFYKVIRKILLFLGSFSFFFSIGIPKSLGQECSGAWQFDNGPDTYWGQAACILPWNTNLINGTYEVAQRFHSPNGKDAGGKATLTSVCVAVDAEGWADDCEYWPVNYTFTMCVF